MKDCAAGRGGAAQGREASHKAQHRVYLIPGYHLISEGSLGLLSFLLLGGFLFQFF